MNLTTTWRRTCNFTFSRVSNSLQIEWDIQTLVTSEAISAHPYMNTETDKPPSSTSVVTMPHTKIAHGKGLALPLPQSKNWSLPEHWNPVHTLQKKAISMVSLTWPAKQFGEFRNLSAQNWRQYLLQRLLSNRGQGGVADCCSGHWRSVKTSLVLFRISLYWRLKFPLRTSAGHTITGFEAHVLSTQLRRCRTPCPWRRENSMTCYSAWYRRTSDRSHSSAAWLVRQSQYCTQFLLLVRHSLFLSCQ